MVQVGTVLATLIAGSGIAVAQQADAPVVDLHVIISMGDCGDSANHVLLRGAPLEVAVMLGRNQAAVQQAAIEAWRLARDKAVQEGKPVVPFRAPAAGDDGLLLPVEGAGWIDYVSVELERLDAAGTAEVVIDSAQTHAAFLAAWPPPGHEQAIAGPGPIWVNGVLPAELVQELADGRYRLKAAFDTRASAEAGVWKGRIEATAGPLEMRRPVTAHEHCDVSYRCLCWSIEHRESATARQTLVEAILAAEDSYRNFEAWALLGDLREEQGDAEGARRAWQQYVDKATWNPESDDPTGYRVREKLGLPMNSTEPSKR